MSDPTKTKVGWKRVTGNDPDSERNDSLTRGPEEDEGEIKENVPV